MKLRRKLLSAGLALGATALTLTTSTFAWYTANTEVSMSGVSAQSAGSDASTLLISSASTQGTFGSSATLTNRVTSLIPVQYTAGTAAAPTFNKIVAGNTNNATGSVTLGTDVLSFDLYFKASSATSVYFKSITLTTTGAMTPKDVLTTSGTSITNAATTATYTVDIQRTLKMAWTTQNWTAGTSAAISNSTARVLDSVTRTLRDDSIGDSDSWNAHTYYNVVSGEHLITDETKAVTTDFTANSANLLGVTPVGTANGTYMKATFYFFIDGWDLECFDACQGQEFSVAMQFTSDATVAANFVSQS